MLRSKNICCLNAIKNNTFCTASNWCGTSTTEQVCFCMYFWEILKYEIKQTYSTNKIFKSELMSQNLQAQWTTCNIHFQMFHKISYLNLHLQVHLELWQECKKYCKWEFKYFRDRGHTILGESYTQVLLDGCHKHFIGSEYWTSILEDWQQQMEGQNLRTQLMWPVTR